MSTTPFDVQAELATLMALIAALRPTDTPTFRARQAEAIARIGAVRQYLDHPMAGLFLQNQDFDRRRAEALRQQRHAKWLRLNCVTDETAPLFRCGVPPSGRLWAERVAMFVRDRAAVTTADVIAELRINETDQVAQTRIARILKAMGWHRRRIGKDSARRYVWCPEQVTAGGMSFGARQRKNGRIEPTGTPDSVNAPQRNPGHREAAHSPT